jgi:hypothetical protein
MGWGERMLQKPLTPLLPSGLKLNANESNVRSLIVGESHANLHATLPSAKFPKKGMLHT